MHEGWDRGMCLHYALRSCHKRAACPSAWRLEAAALVYLLFGAHLLPSSEPT